MRSLIGGGFKNKNGTKQQQQQDGNNNNKKNEMTAEIDSYLKRLSPDSTVAERERFAGAFLNTGKKSNGSSSSSSSNERKDLNYCAMVLMEYIDWRKDYHLDDPVYISEKEDREDHINWEDACAIALEREREKKKKKKGKWIKRFRRRRRKNKKNRTASIDESGTDNNNNNNSDYAAVPTTGPTTTSSSTTTTITSAASDAGEGSTIPQICFVHKNNDGTVMTAKDGKMIIHMLPEQVDTSMAKNKTFGLLFSLYLDNYFFRNSTETANIVIDVRAGMGWANPNLSDLVSFIRSVVKFVHLCHPERVHRAIIFPVPKVAKAVWEIMKKILPKVLYQRVVLVCGDDAWNAPPPVEGLLPYIDEKVINHMEQKRQDCYRYIQGFQYVEENSDEILQTTALAVENLLLEEEEPQSD